MCMCVCAYVRMCVCAYVRMCVCAYVWSHFRSGHRDSGGAEETLS